MRTLAFRRHQEVKKKKWAKKAIELEFRNSSFVNQVRIGIYAHTPCRCSRSWCCGNPRKEGHITIHEMKQREYDKIEE